ncbi:malonate decarboxylase subunit epsilon [Saccharibacillus sp. CPCC 101409]|uniref:malonate decarboxylase subunit epsilon n=1 Tax=Saccharibacillus sp. CPCC 101409 TaxID=3058041 RepID=UPI0026737044|nr:malonate decarboxylase subunit epsilon [Saccharibacillus sp. CPCC 101409]MDO3410403.1 malonate decarboxylase subunit epsilon [Saccharibacillus sp. CPCC 101409]
MGVMFLFPGQGGQREGMLRELPEHREVERTLEEASDTLGRDIHEFETAEALRTTDNVQICLCTAGVAVSRLLEAEGARPDFVGGHSAGAFAAAVSCGSLDFADALRLVRLRGRRMRSAYPSGYGMGVVTGLVRRQVEAVLSAAKLPVYIANLNAPTQIALAGELTALDAVLEACKAKGANRASRLNMSVPSHCELLRPAAQALEEALDSVEVRDPSVPYAGNYKGRALRTAALVREDLARNIAHTVRWHEVVTLFYELGARLFLEMPPGQALTGLARAAFPDARAEALSVTRTDNAALLARRERERRA